MISLATLLPLSLSQSPVSFLNQGLKLALTKSAISISTNSQGKREDSSIIRPQRPKYRSSGTGSKSPAMQGFSCVSLLEDKTWRRGSKEYAVIFRGVRYWLTGPTNWKNFVGIQNGTLQRQGVTAL